MNQMTIHPPDAPGKTFCAAADIGDDLAEQVTRDGAGRPFAPVALTASDDPAELAAQFELLMRPDAVGGGEALLRDNGERIGTAALARLHRRLATGAEVAALRPFLADLSQELSRLRVRVAQRSSEIERELHACQGALRGWQAATGQEPGLLRNLVGWFLGGTGRIALPQAVSLWNERERLALSRHACTTALAVIGRLADEVDTLLDGQEALLRAAERALAAARGLARPHTATERYAPWTWQGSPAAIADQLVGQAGNERLLAALLAQIATAGAAADLAVSARALAEAEAAQIVGALTLADTIVAEAGSTGLEGIDPLVLVGQRLLSELEQTPAWRLQRGARPRVEVVQVTGSGEPLFQLDGLGTAAYGDGADRLGFVRLESGVASDDLRAMHEGAEAFAQILAQRNLYVIEELAHEMTPRPSADLASEATVAPPISHAEGQGLVTTRNGLHTSDAWRPIDG
jgi:hypothetical protein